MAKDQSPAFPWHLGVFDAHCHPTDTLSSLQSIPGMRARFLTMMATRAQDQGLVANAADEYGISEEDAVNADMDGSEKHRVIPAFGWHPWFSHQMFDESEYDGAEILTAEQKAAHYREVLSPMSENVDFLRSLPNPRPFKQFLDQTRDFLKSYPLALVGEVGLDRSFRIPEDWLPEQVEDRDDTLTPGGREGRKLSPYRVSMEHQKKVLLAQLRLAGEMQRAVSVHGVQAHGVVHDTLASTWKGQERHVSSKKERKKQEAAEKADAKPSDRNDRKSSTSGPKPYPPRICLHSFSGPAETVRQYFAPSVPCEVFFSFSTTINAWANDGEGKVEAVVKAVPGENILVESDMHVAGEDMDSCLEGVVNKICEVKQWELTDGVLQLGRNWKRFVLGLS